MSEHDTDRIVDAIDRLKEAADRIAFAIEMIATSDIERHGTDARTRCPNCNSILTAKYTDKTSARPITVYGCISCGWDWEVK